MIKPKSWVVYDIHDISKAAEKAGFTHNEVWETIQRGECSNGSITYVTDEPETKFEKWLCKQIKDTNAKIYVWW